MDFFTIFNIGSGFGVMDPPTQWYVSMFDGDPSALIAALLAIVLFGLFLRVVEGDWPSAAAGREPSAMAASPTESAADASSAKRWIHVSDALHR